MLPRLASLGPSSTIRCARPILTVMRIGLRLSPHTRLKLTALVN
jgi:hypothetical protein